MMTSLRGFLISVQSVYALVGERILRAPAPQGVATPFITVQRIAALSYHSAAGQGGVIRETWQLDCWAASASSRDSVATAVRRALDCYAGTMGSETIESCFLTSIRESTADMGDASGNCEFRSSMDFEIVRQVQTEDRTTTTTTTT